jgi:hypothetical protein
MAKQIYKTEVNKTNTKKIDSQLFTPIYKSIKRGMYGRADFELLRRKVILSQTG